MKKRISCSILALILCANFVYAERDKKHPVPIATLKDDRNTELINTNFKELEGFVIDKSSYNCLIGSVMTVTTVTFVVPSLDLDYGVFVSATWDARPRVLQKTTTGFYIQYDAPATAGKSIDWIVTR